MRTRIAPTPSGLLHAGNALNFLLVEELARRTGARILLRIDDLDADRAHPACVADIFRVLRLLGITWHEGPRDPEDLRTRWSQGLRLGRYHALIDELVGAGAVFACTCSRSTAAACQCASLDRPPSQPDSSLRLRTRNSGTVVAIGPDGSRRELEPHALMPEPVIRRRDGLPAYQVASLADDLDHGIDLIVRGEDLLPSTATQLLMARSIGRHAFMDARFVHHPLRTDAVGRKLSKSTPTGTPMGLDPSAAELASWRDWTYAQADRALGVTGLRP
jgi:glutamyl-tRNA synthetase